MRPAISPDLRAALTAAAPARVTKKLDADPGVAESWHWSQDGPVWTVDTGAQKVRLDGETLDGDGQVSCDCLLSPRCLHLLAVVAALPETGAAAVPEAAEEEPPPAPVTLSAKQREAADLAWSAGAALLAEGASRAGTPARDALRHAAESARRAKLPALSAIATRVLSGLSGLASDEPSFRLPQFTEDLWSLLAISGRLRGEPTEADLGIARRDYGDASTGRLSGLFAERVVTASGYAGVVTYVADAEGLTWTVADVRPGDASRVDDAYRRSEWGPPPRDLCRLEVFATGLTMSADGRLGQGGKTFLARVGHQGWPDALWAVPFEKQLDRALAAVSGPEDERRAGDDLLFVAAELGGLTPGALTVHIGETPVSVIAATDAQPVTGNLRRLSLHSGRTARMILRVHPRLPRTAFALAVGDCPELGLPEAWHGHANLTLDELPGPTGSALGHLATDVPDPLEPVARTRRRAVLSGRAGVRGAVLDGVRAGLRRHRMPAAAAMLGRLAEEAGATVLRATGESVPAPPDALAEAWVACGVYETAARRALLRHLWTV
ncbi:hypothetical protein Afil01_56550 [Actinorhabdospora filicis]|uniref:SWIM-type domain-containing protein n=1 Tax=Actinorhabdospora filicis TaxID=1785913 RepID=A0A9W6SRN8_9ACTN|nr:hypothetical protein [Actinorhabdospora filicis]GLZ80848.1 hypothetical protein Afil01_56550 [Actinorhabdospora filicis]